jgi:hypothetical protein
VYNFFRIIAFFLLYINQDTYLNSKNGLLSFNNFLSTSLEESISRSYARNVRDEFGMIGILFRMKIDDRLWQVELEITADDDQQLQALIANIRF